MIPYNAATARIEIVLSGRVVDTRLVSARAPQMRDTKSSTFSAQQANGEPQRAIRLQWEASDADRDTLTYMVEIAPIGSDRWETIAIGLRTTEVVLTSAQFADRKALQVRITANDGYNQSAPLKLTVNRP